MRLHLVQHGDALSESVDPERPLSDKGRSDVAAVAKLLGNAGLRPGRVVHSGKLRARQTAELLAEALAPDVAPEVMDGLAPKDPVEPAVARLRALGDDALVVGHQPFLGHLIARLVTGSENPVLVARQPGTALALEASDGERFVLAWMIRPDLASGG